MGSRSEQRRRARPETRTGRARADVVATRLGVGLREARRTANRSQADVGEAAGVSQGLVSMLERGHGASTPIETWACLAAAVGEQFVAFLEHASGAHRPRDIEHLRRQSALIELASTGSWSALPELSIDRMVVRGRSIDVALVRPPSAEAVVGEIWDWFDDVGAALRGLDAKVQAVAGRLPGLQPTHETEHSRGVPARSTRERPPRMGQRTSTEAAPDTGPVEAWRVRGLFVVRDTRRNRRLITELRPLFAARFRGSSRDWLSALTDPGRPMPGADGLLWSNRSGSGLIASRLGRPGS